MIQMPVEDLANLPPRSNIFVDTIIFDLHFKSKSIVCSALMRRIALGEVTAYVNTQILSDLLHKSMLAEAYRKGLITSANHQKLKKLFVRDRTAAPSLTDYQQQVEDVLTFGVKVLRISRKTIIESKHERSSYALMTGDSLHIHTMSNHSVPLTNIVTHDGDFAHISTLTVWQPQDVII
jgi:predicted nucleic acid-binding protein